MKVVLDTNTLISGMLWNGNERRVVELAIKKRINNCVSQQSLEECYEVLQRKKFEQIRRINPPYDTLKKIVRNSEFYGVSIVDMKDDKHIIELAKMTDSTIITGDKELIEKAKDVRALTAKKLLKIILEQ